jgi:carotenoid 1,2-hydratase
VAHGGYAWWYVDAISDDGRCALVAIAFLGSVFSPYYARARAKATAGQAEPLQHVAINVALYGPGGKRWAMTERSQQQLSRSASQLTIGPSSVAWDGNKLRLSLDEWSQPWPARLRGSVTLHPLALAASEPLELDSRSEHRWWPIAPCCRVEVDLHSPHLQWQGNGYLDSNRGCGPLDKTFASWQWSRADLPGGGSAVIYDAHEVDATTRQLALRFGTQGSVENFEAPPEHGLSSSLWRIARSQRCEVGQQPRLVRSLEDTPFYSRSLIDTRWLGQPVRAMHESLDLRRFKKGWVQAMLPFRMPRMA